MYGCMSLRKVLVSLSLSFMFLAGVFASPMFALEDCGQSVETAPQTQNSGSSQVPTPDWLIEAETSPSPKTFEHECFTFKPIVKTSVRYCKFTDQGHKLSYEELWYHDGKPLGMEQIAGLDIAPDQNVKIKATHKLPCSSFDEVKAATNIIMRLILDVLLTRAKITSVEVPASSFQGVLQELQKRKGQLVPPGQEAPATAKVVFQLESGTTGLKQKVYFL